MNHRPFIIAAIALLAVLVLLAPSAVADLSDEQESRAKIIGRTLDGLGQSLPGVLVVLDSGENTTSKPDGSFSLFTTPGDHTVTFYKENYTSEKVFVSIDEGQGTIDLGEINLRADINPNQHLIFILFIGCSLFVIIVVLVAFMSKD